nr:hypothetical protein [Erysipelothrix rhusiopathiae]
MKKLLVSLLALLMLAGCSDARAMISTDEEIFSVGNEKVTSKRLFDVMKLSDGGMTVVKSAQNKITENVADEDVKAEADKRLEEIKEVFGDQLEERLKQSGYESVDAFMSQTVYPELKMTHLLKEKMVTDFEALTTENAPRKARILQLENQEKADEALEKLKQVKTSMISQKITKLQALHMMEVLKYTY